MFPNSDFISIARSLVSCPTAPFHERYALQVIHEFAKNRPQLALQQDSYGNVLLLYNGTRSKRNPRLVLTAHLDHPGLIYHERIKDTQFIFGLYGGVTPALLKGATIRIYDVNRERQQRPFKGRIVRVKTEKNRRTLVTLETTFPLPFAPSKPGTFATWDLPPWRQRGNRLNALACDDLVGASVALSFLDQLIRDRTPTRAGVLLTRAEEVGFVGMLAALNEGYLDPEALYINIECSSVKAGAQMGGGPIVRVGDRMSIFSPQITAALAACAEEIQATEPSFKYQRKLMDSGACEATPMVHRGLQTGAVALPLGNYHNIGENALKPEQIAIPDALFLKDLLVHFVQRKGGAMSTISHGSEALTKGLNSRLESYRSLLEATSPSHCE